MNLRTLSLTPCIQRPKAKVENYKELGLNSETAVMFNITSREQVIINTWYGGEMKKVFSR